jgi:hypothetical protein
VRSIGGLMGYRRVTYNNGASSGDQRDKCRHPRVMLLR